MTEAEKKLWRRLQNYQLDGRHFRKQVPIGVFIADFCCLREKLIVEVDGGQHAASGDDAVRTKWLEAQGYTVLRFWNNDVLGNIDGVVATILLALEALPKQPPLNPPPEGGGL